MSSRRGKRWVGVLAVAGALLLSLWVPHAARWLVADDHVAHADVALVLSGDPIRRALAARDLYRAGRADRIVVIPEPPNDVDDELATLGLLEPGLPPIAERILVASGVPKDRIAFLPTPADGTITEAVQVRAWFGGQLPARTALITNPLASRRARYIFRRVFRGRHVSILSAPTPYGAYQLDRWWAHPRSALYVAMEYQKWVASVVTLMFGVQGG